ncbi:hypothetical protein AVEN_231948-1 [Araneus ventricosus]|uniref:Uncharacterized protein n=1 Tax=Araneus ventricosus TaxID=182803 RepID=A0A4Y2C0W5_ARAVE|nr:hypothetical protein AVEN_231948-1 [Araneus ventricosus]
MRAHLISLHFPPALPLSCEQESHYASGKSKSKSSETVEMKVSSTFPGLRGFMGASFFPNRSSQLHDRSIFMIPAFEFLGKEIDCEDFCGEMGENREMQSPRK